MLHTRKLAEYSAVLQDALQPVVKKHGIDGTPDGLAKDHDRWGLRIDLSKSAAKLRRRLFAMWRSPLVLHELVALTDAGWGLRPPETGPDLVGELVVDHMKLFRGVRMLHAGGRDTVKAEAAVDFLTAFIQALARASKTGPRGADSAAMATLWALHGMETARRVKKEGAGAAVVKQLKTVGLPEQTPAQVDAHIKTLNAAGFIQDEQGKYWRLQGEVRFGF